ncbi:MAG: hypothetical protein KDB73_16235, partial [Planctomycetes bacterium]|nr:hypothetical protein [Planctomycetota bacterium]
MVKALMLLVTLAVGFGAGAWWARADRPGSTPREATEREGPGVGIFSVEEIRGYVMADDGKPEPNVQVVDAAPEALVELLPTWHDRAPNLRVRCYTEEGYVELGVTGREDGDDSPWPEERRSLTSMLLSTSPVHYTLWYRSRILRRSN